jgi:hypothetical protein
MSRPPKKIYYAHAMPIYGSKVEAREKCHITKNFPEHDIVDPGSFEDNPEKKKGGMAYCLKLVESCDALVFTRFYDEITSGVGQEINHAIKNKIAVYELKQGRITKIKKPVTYLSMDETVGLYFKIGYYSSYI